MTTKIRVLVVEDSLTVRRRLVDVIARDAGFEVVGEADDGKRATELCAVLRPDVVMLDMMLPVMTGLAATEYIMAHCPTPILIVSASTNRGDLFKMYEALAAGAVDVLEKPRGDEPEGVWERKLLETLRLVSRIRVITHPRGRHASFEKTAPRIVPPLPSGAARARRIVAIGASTGGPRAILDILRGIPVGFPLPILIVLHIDEPFGAAFADWLDGQTGHRVRYGADGEALASFTPGVVMAPPGRHLVVSRGRIALTTDPERHSCRPSVDVLFESLASEYGPGAAACLLTGMGRDGAAGLLAVRKAGGLTIAQDETTSVVYGMPREAVLLGAAERVLPVGAIGPELAALAMNKRAVGQ